VRHISGFSGYAQPVVGICMVVSVSTGDRERYESGAVVFHLSFLFFAFFIILSVMSTYCKRQWPALRQSPLEVFSLKTDAARVSARLLVLSCSAYTILGSFLVKNVAGSSNRTVLSL
jgi:hypothetical protein